MNNFLDKNEFFTAELIIWYNENKRDLPWRNTQDPYFIWLSEIILQQTRVIQGLAYYQKFTQNYPTVISLAESTEEQILKDWQGLGYYSRARNLYAAAKFVSDELDGQFPKTFKTIKELKGVGDYTAAAIASFAFDLPHAVVDGNVFRVLSRYFGVDTPIDSVQGKKQFGKIAQEILDLNDPATHNQAVMEFGALQCTPKNPKCEMCPLNSHCVAFKLKLVERLPFKEKKIKQRTRFLNYLVFEYENETAVNYRDEKGIWQNLYDFPVVESEKELTSDQLLENENFKKFTNEIGFTIEGISTLRKHILSHQILLAKFYHIRINNHSAFLNENYRFVSKTELSTLPIPKLIENYLNEETNLLSLF